MFKRNRQFYRFAAYGFLKNLRFFEPFIILFLRDAALTYLQIGALFSIRDVATNILEIPTGVYADTFGRRRAMVLGFAAYIASFFVFFAFSGFYFYAAAMILFACGEAFRTGTHKALILEYLRLNDMEHLKVEYYGRTRAASQLGSALNAIVAAALVLYSGNYRYVFVASVVPYILDLVNLATYPKELDGELLQDKQASVGARLLGTLRDFCAVFRNLAAMRTILNSSGFDAFFKATKEYVQPVLRTFALALPILVALDGTRRSALVVGIVYSVLYLITSYASRSAAGFSRLFRSPADGINATFLAGAACLLAAGLGQARGLPAVSIAAFAAFYVLHNVRRPMNVARVSDQTSSKVMAAGLSAESQVTTILAALLAPALGALADWLGVGPALACLGAGMVVLSLLLWVRSGVGAQGRRTVAASQQGD